VQSKITINVNEYVGLLLLLLHIVHHTLKR